MVITMFDAIVSNLDRRIEFLRRVPQQEVLFEAYDLVQWLLADPLLGPYAQRMLNDCGSERRSFHKRLEKRYNDALVACGEALRLQPNLVFSAPQRHQVEPELVPESDYSDAFELIEALLETLRAHPAFSGAALEASAPHKDLLFQVHKLRSDQHADFRLFANLQRMSPSTSLAYLTRLQARPDLAADGATDYAAWRSKLQHSLFRAPNSNISVHKDDPLERTRIQLHAERVCMHLRLLVGTTHTYHMLARRFVTRSQWYDRERLRAAAKHHATRTKQIEAALVLEFAKYLFDHGLPVLLGPRVWKLEPDVFGPATTPFVAEGKAYTTAVRQVVVNGVAQLFSYMANIDGHPYRVREGYYLVFRLDGPLYRLPETLHVGEYTIYPLLVDLADIASSGRRQKRIEVLDAEAFLPTVKKHTGRMKKPA